MERDATISGTDPFAALNAIAMTMIGRLMASVLGVCVASVCYCQEQPDFWKRDYDTRTALSRAAAVANPGLVRRLNEAAARCVGQMQSDLMELAKSHPVLVGIDKVKPETGDDERPDAVSCMFAYSKNATKRIRASQGIYPAPEKDGVILSVTVQDVLCPAPRLWGVTASYRMVVGGIGVVAGYKLELGEDNQALVRPIRNIMEKRLMEFCNAYADKEIIHSDSPTMRKEIIIKGIAPPQP